MKRNRVLLINTQFVELYISGFTNRFIGLWCHTERYPETKALGEIHWLTNRSLWNKFFNGRKKQNSVTIMNANLKLFKFTSRLFYPFFIIYVYYRKRCTSVHVATSIIDSLYLVRLFNLLRIPYCFTFASNSLEMASYGSKAVKRKWAKLFSLAKNVEVLNPSNTIEIANGRKFISPNSFPYLIEFLKIPQHKFINPKRDNTIVFCGSLIPQKNPLFAISGFQLFLQKFGQEFPDVKFLIVGKGELKTEVENQVNQINQQYGRAVIELVNDKDLVDILSTSKLFLSLQDYDNYPSQSLMEAMIFCNSVISIDNGDTSRLVLNEYGNILLSEKCVSLLALGIKSVLQNWRLNLINRQHILDNFSPKVFSEHFFSMHRQITDR